MGRSACARTPPSSSVTAKDAEIHEKKRARPDAIRSVYRRTARSLACAVKGVWFSAGNKSRLATVAPASSNRSRGGGDKSAKAFDGKGCLGSSASRQAGTQVNAIEASKR